MKFYARFDVLSATLAPGRGLQSREATINRLAHRAAFEYEPRPGYLYVRSRAISSRCNDNYDDFPADEIRQAYASFVGKPVFVNHHNSNHKRARGVIVAAALHEDSNPDGTPDTWVEVLMEVDAVRFPKLAQAVLAGEVDRTSMGCDVAYSLCSFCGNKAATPLEYCAHIPKLKGQRIRRRTASGSQEDVLVREICYGLHFFENSLLVEEPADPTAFAWIDGVTPDTVASLQVAASKATAVASSLRIARKGPAMARTASKLTFVHPRTGDTYTRRTDASYSHVSFKNGEIAWHTTEQAARRRSNEVYPVSGGGSTPSGSGGSSGGSKPTPKTYKTMWDHIYDHHGGRMPATGYQGLSEAEKLDKLRDIHDAEHAGGYSQLKHRHGSLTVKADRKLVPVEKLQAGDKVRISGPDWTVTGTEEVPYDQAGTLGVRVFFEERPQGMSFAKGYAMSVEKAGQRGLNDAEMDERMRSAPGYGQGKMTSGCPVCNKTVTYPNDDDGTFRRHTWPGGAVCDASGKTVSEAQALADADRERQRQQERFGSIIATNRPITRTAIGEIKAPAQIDTLRDEDCPVCGESSSYDGDKCSICGFVRPPSSFMDPDLTKARETDLRQQADDLPTDEEANLRCSNCGATFQGDDQAVSEQTDTDSPSDDDVVPEITDDEDQPDDDGDKKPFPPKGKSKSPFPPKGKTKAALPAAPGQPSGAFQKLEAPKGDSASSPTPDQAPVDGEEQADTAPKAGDICPSCGQGTLEVIPKSVGQDGDAAEAAQAPGAAPEPGAPSADEGGPDKEPNPADEDTEKPGVAPPKPDPKDDDDDEERPKKKAPFPPKKSSTLSNRLRVRPKGWNDQSKESDMRQALALILAQQRVIEAQGAALHRIASLAGLEGDATVRRALSATASLRAYAADENPAQPTGWANPGGGGTEAPAQSTADALGDLNDEDVTKPGATAVTDVSADATTSLSDTGTVLDAPLNLNEQDPTKQVAGTDDLGQGGRGNAGTNQVETDVRVGDANNTDVAFPLEPNWTTKGSSLQAPERTEGRTIASLRLARLRLQADIASGDDLDLATEIDTSGLDDAAIQSEIDVLSKVVRSKTAGRGQERRPVVARRTPVTASVPTRAMPSFASEPQQSNLVAAGNISALASVSDDEILFD